MSPIPKPVADRFAAKTIVDEVTGCVLWTGHLERGYGRFWVSVGVYAMPHRWAWEQIHGPIDEALTIDHLCRVRNCVNLDHLEVVTRGENTLRGETIVAANRAKEACMHGHPFTPENTYHPPRTPKSRQCRTCKCEWKRAMRRNARLKVLRKARDQEEARLANGH